MRVPSSPVVVSLFALIQCASAGTIPQSQHIWIITEENHSYEKVMGNSDMPYFNSLKKSTLSPRSTMPTFTTHLPI
jgi:hypothetical protein